MDFAGADRKVDMIASRQRAKNLGQPARFKKFGALAEGIAHACPNSTIFSYVPSLFHRLSWSLGDCLCAATEFRPDGQNN
jgi:hypothetical protein